LSALIYIILSNRFALTWNKESYTGVLKVRIRYDWIDTSTDAVVSIFF